MTFFNDLAALWPKPKYLFTGNDRLIILLILSAYVLVNSSSRSFAQSHKDSEAGVKVSLIKALKVGDQVPEEFWTQEHQLEEQGSIRLSTLESYRGTLLILDFWASWCGPCLAAFPRIDSLAVEHPNVSFLKVTGEGKSINKQTKSIISDTILTRYFPHNIIPHFVWIYPTGEVAAFSSADQLNTKNISAALDRESENISNKNDLDYTKPLFFDFPYREHQITSYSSLIKGPFKGLPSGVNRRKPTQYTVGFSITNRSLHMIYATIARELLMDLDSSYRHTPIRIDVPESASLAFGKDWSDPDNVVYSYDLEVGLDLQDRLYDMAVSDLNSRTGFHGEIIWEDQDALELTVVGDTAKLSDNETIQRTQLTRGKPIRMKASSLNRMVDYWNSGRKLDKPVVNATGIVFPVSLSMTNSNDLSELNEALANYGLKLSAKRIHLPIFVVSGNQHIIKKKKAINHH